MKKYFTILSLVCFLAIACKKENTAPVDNKPKTGYDHTTPEGMMLERLPLGNNRKLTGLTYTYYSAIIPTLVHSTVSPGVPANSFLFFNDDITFNSNYFTYVTVSGDSPLLHNSISDVHFENGTYYLYYQPNKSATPLSDPSTVIKVKFTLSTDNKTLVLIFTDGPGIGNVSSGTFQYSSRVRTYTYVSL